MTRTRVALTVTTLGLAGLLALAACGVAAPAPVADAPDGDVLALTAVGFETGLDETPAPAASASGRSARPGPARKLLRKNTLHGEVTVQTKKGVTTVVVQRGTVTAVGAGTVSVKSSDGFAATWTFDDALKVRKDRKAADRAAVVVGAQVGVAGAKADGTNTARLIAVT